MAISAFKVWIAGEVLFATDLNSSISRIIDNGAGDLSSPRTGNLAVTSTYRIDLDDDADTSIRSSVDDQIDFEVGGTDRLVVTATDIQFNGESLMSRGDIRRLGVPTMLMRLGTLEARATTAESHALAVSQMTNF
jgi:hypothetical protein